MKDNLSIGNKLKLVHVVGLLVRGKMIDSDFADWIFFAIYRCDKLDDSGVILLGKVAKRILGGMFV